MIVSDIPSLPFGLDALQSILPQDGGLYLGLYAWQWVALVLLVVGAWAVGRILYVVMRPIVLGGCKKLGFDTSDALAIKRATRALSLAVSTAVIGRFLPWLLLPEGYALWLGTSVDIVTIVLTILTAYRLVGLIAQRLAVVYKTDSSATRRLVPFFGRALKVVLVVIGFVLILSRMHVDLTAVLAGLSIGGAALALASQDTIKNIFGAVTIMTDRPFVVGDWIIVTDGEGTVEDIGLRSTRIRTFADSVLTIPNGRLADMAINNMGMRVYRRYRTMLGIQYNTPPESVLAFVDGVRNIISTHPAILRDPNRIVSGFFEYDASSLSILVNTFMTAATLAEEVQIRTELNMAFLVLASKLGVSFAFPSRTIYYDTPQTPAVPHSTPAS
jgi:MscS family membrane protein